MKRWYFHCWCDPWYRSGLTAAQIASVDHIAGLRVMLDPGRRVVYNGRSARQRDPGTARQQPRTADYG